MCIGSNGILNVFFFFCTDGSLTLHGLSEITLIKSPSSAVNGILAACGVFFNESTKGDDPEK